MSSLGNKLIRDSYFGLIKTEDEGAIDDNLKQLQDGAGNALPVQVSATGMKYSGTQDFSDATVIGIGGGGGGTTYDLSSEQNGSNVDITLTGSDTSVDIVKLVAGSNVTIDGSTPNEITISATGGGGGGLENYNGYPWSVQAQGYGNTYARASQNVNSEVYWDGAIDQNANTAIFARWFVEPGKEVTSVIIPFYYITDITEYEFAIYDTYESGAPRNKIFTTTVTVPAESTETFVTTDINWTPTQNRYWAALQSETTGSKIGMCNRGIFQNNYFTYGAWGGAPVGLLAINSLYYNGGNLPVSFDELQTYGHRDEGILFLYRTA